MKAQGNSKAVYVHPAQVLELVTAQILALQIIQKCQGNFSKGEG